jgi:hypothetical protein
MRNVPNLVTKFDGTDPNYPDGKFKDDAVAGDNTGSELIEKWPNDILGALYAIIRGLGQTTPDNSAEYPDQSQLNDILENTIRGNKQFAAFCNHTPISGGFGTVALNGVAEKPNVRSAVVGISAGNGIIYSSEDNGWQWTSRSSTANDTYNEVIWDPGFGSFIGVGQNTTPNGRILTSPDGITWTLGSFGADALNDVVTDGTIAVAVGNNGKILTSLLATEFPGTWNSQTPAGSYSGNFEGITYDENSGLFIAVGSNGAIQTSPDGINWTARTAAASYTATFRDIVWFEKENLNVAIGPNNAGTAPEVQTSPDGITWTQQTTGIGNPPSIYPVRIKTTKYGLFAVGSGTGNPVMMFSKDGITWYDATIADFAGNSIVYRSLGYINVE